MKSVDIKAWDIKNRRQDECTINNFHDLACAKYFTVGSDLRKYILSGNLYNEWCIYLSDNETGTELIGYATSVNKRHFDISFKKYGFMFSTRIKLFTCKGFGNKLPMQK